MINKLTNKLKSGFSWIISDKKRVVVTVLILVATVFGIYYLNSKNTSSASTYQTSIVSKGTLISTVSASGRAVTTNILEVKTSATGVIKKVYVADGQKVVKGQKIAEITLDQAGIEKNASAYASYINAQNSVNSANNSYRSAVASAEKVLSDVSGHDSDETLAQKETRTKAEVARDNAYDGLRSASANLTSAALAYQLSSPFVVAPYAGTIQNLSIVEGINITAEKRVGTMVLTGNPIVEVSLSEVDVTKVKVGQKATITFDSLSDKSFTGAVATVDRLGSTTSSVTSYSAYIKLDSASSDLLTNMSGTANIILNSITDVLIIPSSAIETTNNITYAKVFKNGSVNLTEVVLGVTGDSGVEVKSGISEGETVVTGTTSTAKTTTTTKSVFSGIGGGGATFQRN